ncbi:hypothetical protein ACJJTC_007635 [Scirpophaga incertulas]
MASISKRRKEGSKTKGIGDHKEFLKRITKTLYYAQLPKLPGLSLPVTEISCEAWSAAHRGRSLRRLHADAAARLARGACVSPCALVLALLYLERLHDCNPAYLAATSPSDLFLVSLMVGNKFLQDDGEDDEVMCSEWATSGGLELKQLKKLEGWNVFVSDECFESGLRRLERRVALREARRRGYFTYGDLAAAGGAGDGTCGAGAGAVLAAAALAAALAAAALLASFASSATLATVHTPANVPANATWSAVSTPSTSTSASDIATCGWTPCTTPQLAPLEPAPPPRRPPANNACSILDHSGAPCHRYWLNLTKLTFWTSVSDR